MNADRAALAAKVHAVWLEMGQNMVRAANATGVPRTSLRRLVAEHDAMMLAQQAAEREARLAAAARPSRKSSFPEGVVSPREVCNILIREGVVPAGTRHPTIYNRVMAAGRRGQLEVLFYSDLKVGYAEAREGRKPGVSAEAAVTWYTTTPSR